VDPERSILAQRRDPDTYPEITRLAEVLGDVRIYREWSFGRYTPARLPQATDAPNKWMAPDASNLALILSKLKRNPVARSVFIDLFRAIYSDVVDVDVLIEGGTAQIFVQEDTFIVPATRLSDGTLRYLCLLAILCDPEPPPLVCIDEPELGLHPDVVSKLAEALLYASERTQLIVTTHSAALVDAFTQDPEAILVCEKDKGATVLRRLDSKQLAPWLKTYRLGSLWTSGEIGGTRW
jgi:predicted ATPase